MASNDDSNWFICTVNFVPAHPSCREIRPSFSLLLNVALIKSRGTLWASLSLNQQPTNVPHAVFLHRNLDVQHLVCPSNKIIPALTNQTWHFLCSGREGSLRFFALLTFCVNVSAFTQYTLYRLINSLCRQFSDYLVVLFYLYSTLILFIEWNPVCKFLLSYSLKVYLCETFGRPGVI